MRTAAGLAKPGNSRASAAEDTGAGERAREMVSLFTGFTGGRIDRFTFTMTMLGALSVLLLYGAVALRLPIGGTSSIYAFIGMVLLLFSVPWVILVAALKRARDIGWNVLWVGVMICVLWPPVVLALAVAPTDYARRDQQAT